MARRFLTTAALMVCATLGTLVGQQVSSPDQQPPQRVRISSGVATKLVVKAVNPVYPKELRKRRVQGMVVLNVTIGTGGNVMDAAPVSGPSELLQFASDAVKQWKFNPYLLNGQPVIAETQIIINFTLSGT